MALNPAQMQEAIIKNLPAKTGKNLHEWVIIAKSLPHTKNSEIAKELKTSYGLGHVQAQTIVSHMEGDIPYINTDGYEEGIFTTKDNLQLYNELKSAIIKLKDTTCKPCKTYIPFYRKTQFAIITEKRGEVILGLNLTSDEYPELQSTTKLSGSDRINKAITVTKDNIQTLYTYIKAAHKIN